MPISRQSLSETLSDDLVSLHKARAALSNAWAHRMSASLKAHFAAFGSPLLREQDPESLSTIEVSRSLTLGGPNPTVTMHVRDIPIELPLINA